MYNNNIYYCCKCYHFNGELILCDECNKWVDDVETTIEKLSLNQRFMLKYGRTIRVMKVKIWKNNKSNENQKQLCLYQFSLYNKCCISIKSVFKPRSSLCIRLSILFSNKSIIFEKIGF